MPHRCLLGNVLDLLSQADVAVSCLQIVSNGSWYRGDRDWQTSARGFATRKNCRCDHREMAYHARHDIAPYVGVMHTLQNRCRSEGCRLPRTKAPRRSPAT
ncbi:hypothetical protein IG631_22294 [Alternaria alternata]|nr:hypothetical protein IG631_22294 [Alternaria alternata]